MKTDFPFQFETLVELARWRALNQPDRRAFTFLQDGESQEVHITYSELDRQARAIAAAFQEFNAEGERALLLYPPGLEYIAAFFGCLYAGVVAVPAYPPDPSRLSRTLPRLQAIVKDSQTKIALTTQSLFAMAEFAFEEATDLKNLKWLTTDNVELGTSDEWRNPAITSNALTFLQYTSGSTGHPKGVMISHGNFLHNLLLIHLATETSSESRGVSWLPQYHDMGLVTGILSPLYKGFPAILMSPLVFLRHPFLWLKTISRTRATHSGGPNFAYELCVRKILQEQKEELELSSWEVAFNGAEPVRHETLVRFSEAFKSCGFRREAFLPCYGLAETTVGVSWSNKMTQPIICAVRMDALEQNRVVLASNDVNRLGILVGGGKTPQDQQILIVNPDTLTRCAADQVGEIWVSGPSVAQGYWNRPEESQDIFQAYLKDTGEGPFLRTGDLGFLKEGELFVTGRLKDLIIIRGQNYYPHDIELTVERTHGVLRPGCGAAFSVEVGGEERLVIIHEADTRLPFDTHAVLSEIRQAVMECHEIQPYTIILIKPKSLPKTSSGKVQRYACREQFLKGVLEVVEVWRPSHEPTVAETDPLLRTPIGSVVVKVLQQVLPQCGTLRSTSELARDLGLDSLARIEFWSAIEHAFAITIPEEEIFELKQVCQVIHYLQAQPTLSFTDNSATMVGGNIDWASILEDHPEETRKKVRNLSRTNRWPNLIFLKLFRQIFKRLLHLRVEGLEHLPDHTPFILAPNHASYLDYFFVASVMPLRIQKNLVIMAETDFFNKKSLVRRVVTKFGQVIFLDPAKVSASVLRIGNQVLRQGKLLLIYPEGIRSPDGQLQCLKEGAALLANHMQCPIVPVHIKGAYELWPKGARLPRRRIDISVRIGKPLSPLPSSDTGAPVTSLAQATELTAMLRNSLISLRQQEAI